MCEPGKLVLDAGHLVVIRKKGAGVQMLPWESNLLLLWDWALAAGAYDGHALLLVCRRLVVVPMCGWHHWTDVGLGVSGMCKK